MPHANNKDAVQPVQLHSLIRFFVVRSLDSIISIDVISKSNLCSAEQASLSLTWLKTSVDRFSHDVALNYTSILKTALP